MKKRLKALLAASIHIAFSSTLNAESLRDSIEDTLNLNPQIISEHINREAYFQYVKQEEGDYLPRIDLDAYVERSRIKRDYDNSSTQDGSIDISGWNAILKLEHILYDGGLTPSQVEEFRHQYSANRYKSMNIVENTIFEMIDTYLNLTAKQELTALAQNNIKIHEEYLTVAKEKEQISGEKLETFQVNSKYHDVLDDYLKNENETQQELSLYKKLTGKELSGNICRPLIDETLIPYAIEQALEVGIRRNYKVKEQIAKIRKQREKIVQEKSGYYPTIKVQLQSEWDNDIALEENGREDTYRARLLLNWNLFNGNKTYNATKKEELFLKEEQKRLDQITAEVVDEIKNSYKTFFNNKKRVENLSKYVDDNFNILSVYKKQLADGTRTFIDILNAESELYRSNIDKIEQEFELFKSYYDFLNNMSMLSDAVLMQEKQTCPKYVFKPRIDESQKEQDNDKLSEEMLELFGESSLNKEEVLSKKSDDESLIDNGDKAEEIDIPSRLESIYEDQKRPLAKEAEIPGQNEKAQPKEQPYKKYTLNMGNFKTIEGVKSFIERYSLDKAHYYKWGKKGENIKLLYGSFESVKSAKEAMSLIDKKALSYGTYVDSMKKHTKLIEKYEKFN